jgi:hypothetical protein
MEHAQSRRTEVQNILPWSEERQLEKLVKTLALEIERLNEETKQLRAAVLMYREVARRTQVAGFLHRSPPITAPLSQ